MTRQRYAAFVWISLCSIWVFLSPDLALGCPSSDPKCQVKNGAHAQTPSMLEAVPMNAGEDGRKIDELPEIEAISMKDILATTLALYVEAVPNSSAMKWTKGNDPRIDQREGKKSNVRAVCLGTEDGAYVFLTLRYFLDPNYPNHNIQGVLDKPVAGPRLVEQNAAYTAFLMTQRIWLTAAKHTGGGQLAMGKPNSFSIRNLFRLNRCGALSRMWSNCSEVNGERYKDPIKNVWRAKDVLDTQGELDSGRRALVQTFGDHDVALLRIAQSHWDEPLPTLGLKNPTKAIQLLTEKQSEIFGFKFILMSEDAYTAIRNYEVPDDAKESGLYLSTIAAATVLRPTWVKYIRTADRILLNFFRRHSIQEIDLMTADHLRDIAYQFVRYRFQDEQPQSQ